MKKEDFGVFSKRGEFPPETVADLARDHALLHADARCAALLEDAVARYRAGEDVSLAEQADKLEGAANSAGVHPYAAAFLFYFELAPALCEKYRARGLPDDCFDGVLRDLCCKLRECRDVFGVWGSFVSSWFSLFFDFSLYALGRLEFCLCSCPTDYEKGGLKILKGQPCIDTHIPSCGPLARADLDDAYRRAANFFAGQLKGAPTVFRCHSWLLADYHGAMLPPDSGIVDFARDYDLIARTPDEGDLWRIFGSADPDAPASLPEKTALQRAYKARLIAGEPVYGGEGLFFYENYKAERNIQ